jgi:hypothetical protein
LSGCSSTPSSVICTFRHSPQHAVLLSVASAQQLTTSFSFAAEVACTSMLMVITPRAAPLRPAGYARRPPLRRGGVPLCSLRSAAGFFGIFTFLAGNPPGCRGLGSKVLLLRCQCDDCWGSYSSSPKTRYFVQDLYRSSQPRQ